MIENHAHHRHNNFYDPTTKLRNCEKNPMFIVYSMQGGGYCDKVHQLMHLTKQPYVVYTLDEHFTIDEFEAEFSTKHFPQVIHDHADGRIAERVHSATVEKSPRPAEMVCDLSQQRRMVDD